MIVTILQQKILDVIWLSGGFTFGGTSRDLLRNEQPNDLDIRLGSMSDLDAIQKLGANICEDRKADSGEAYYDKKIVFETGEQIHVKYGFCEVTDCDINLIKISKKEVSLLYVPIHLKTHLNPLMNVLEHINKKEFTSLQECPEHRKYRWKQFQDRGWRKL